MKRFFTVFFIFNLVFFVFAQNSNTARKIAEEAARKETLEQSVIYLKKEVPALQNLAEKRSGYAFLAGVLEQSGNFQEAMNFYVQAAAIAAGDAEGMQKKSSEQLVLDAVRCALSAGDWATAQNYLNSAVRNSSDSEIIAFIKLYEQWSILCQAKTSAELTEPVAILKTYSSLPSMKSVQPQVLLTLWHITGEETYSAQLKKSFPKSLESAIVKGEIQTLPAPFWYFVPRKTDSVPEIASVQSSETENQLKNENSEKSENDSKNEKILRQQLGLFKDKANAEGLVLKLKEKGFSPHITEEIRPSGTKYYLVVVDENKAGSIGNELRNAGFECYPIFE